MIQRYLEKLNKNNETINKHVIQTIKWMYDNNDETGEANKMKFAHVPKEWRQAWEKGSKGEMRDLKEQGMGLGMDRYNNQSIH